MRIKPNTSGSTQGKQATVLQLLHTLAQGNQRQRGFTLLEVMIVMIIMAIMSAVAIPAFSSWRERQAVRNAAQALLSHMKQARTRAVAENRTVTIKFGVDASGNTANAYVFDAGTTGAEKTVTVQYATFSNNLTLTKKNSTTKPITMNFKSRGTVGASTVDFCSSGYTKRITVNRIGRARLCQSGDTDTTCTDPHICP